MKYEEYGNVTAEQIGQVLLVKLGPGFALRSPQVEKIEAKNGPEYVFKAMVGTKASPILLDQGVHFMYFVSRISDKDMDDWLEAAVKKIKAYASDRTNALKF